MPVEQAARQGRISARAFLAFGKERAIAFLNADNERLGGRPLELATASALGETTVICEIERLCGAQSEPDATYAGEEAV